jgi:hypothetical protein
VHEQQDRKKLTFVQLLYVVRAVALSLAARARLSHWSK